jgi:hypothetical protein
MYCASKHNIKPYEIRKIHFPPSSQKAPGRDARTREETAMKKNASSTGRLLEVGCMNESGAPRIVPRRNATREKGSTEISAAAVAGRGSKPLRVIGWSATEKKMVKTHIP